MSARRQSNSPRPHLYIFIFLGWVGSLTYFHPRLWRLIDVAHSPFSWGAILFFIVFTELAWLYGFYNVGVVIFARIYSAWRRKHETVAVALSAPPPAVAILYTTCNDFVEASADSCVAQEYSNFMMYVLDDSSLPKFKQRVDAFAARYPERVRVVRRGDRSGYKAGNINNGLTQAAIQEPLFALVDADEILPPDFLSRLVPRLLADDSCGFVQANHQSNPRQASALGAAMGIGVDIHWRWYQPLRNQYGFVMLLGHGAVVRRSCWKQIGGFPNVVSEDLAFALRIREHGWRGYFAEDVVCYEDFPATIRSFRVRHMKWTRGTCELLSKLMWGCIRSRKISLVEKLDVLFPTLNLPLSLFYFLFVLDANLVFPLLFGRPQTLTFSLGSMKFALRLWKLHPALSVLTGVDFFLITLLTLVSPILCFVIELAPRPGELLRFLCRSTIVYAALGPLSAVGVLFYLATGKAEFHVTADPTRLARQKGSVPEPVRRDRFRIGLQRLISGSHPDHFVVQGFEILCGVILGLTCLKLFQISFFGITIAYVLLPVLHHVSWEHPFMQKLIYVPFLLVIGGLGISTFALLDIQPVFLSCGFHF